MDDDLMQKAIARLLTGEPVNSRGEIELTLPDIVAAALLTTKPADETWDAWLRRLIDGR